MNEKENVLGNDNGNPLHEKELKKYWDRCCSAVQAFSIYRHALKITMGDDDFKAIDEFETNSAGKLNLLGAAKEWIESTRP